VITHQILNKISALYVNSIYNVCALKTLNTYKPFCSLVMRSDVAIDEFVRWASDQVLVAEVASSRMQLRYVKQMRS
jgi:hypothetical protein